MSLSLAQRLRYTTAAKRKKILAALSPAMLTELAVRSTMPWWFESRPEQREPSRVRRWWLILAGRGWGKTRTGAEWIVEKARTHPGARCALVAVSFGDGRDTMVEGESGILSVVEPHELLGGTVERAWNRSLGELFLANGSRFKIYSSERPKQLRGPGVHYLWGDEPAYWNDAGLGCARDTTFFNSNIILRLKPRREWFDYVTWTAQGVLTTTPRNLPLLKVPDDYATEHPEYRGLLQRDDVTVTHGRTMDNIDNLAPAYRAAVIDPLIGTTIGRQELDAELLEDVDGALWTNELISRNRVTVDEMPELARKCVAFDPSGGGGIGHDEHGIIVAGLAGYRGNSEVYVLADYSLNSTPTDAARRVILAWIEHDCDAIVYEGNYGGEWVPTVLQSTFEQMIRDGEIEAQSTSLPLRPVFATRGKQLRAEPVQALYEQGETGRVHHVGVLAVVEGQMTTWVPGDPSPDRLDALVYAVTHLAQSGPGGVQVASPAARERRGRRPGAPSSRMPVVYGTRPGSRLAA